jgi:hypothetical protein
MEQWDELRDKLRRRQDEAADAIQRSHQEQEIVELQQGSLWGELESQFYEAITIINKGRTVLNLAESPTGTALKISAVRAGSTPPNASVTFNENIHELTVAFSGTVMVRPTLKYVVRANSSYQAEFSREGEAEDAKDIVSEALSYLV